MADAKRIISRTVSEEERFQNDPADSGNFFKGVNYGTKFGITPAAYWGYYKKPLQSDTIRDLTIEQAVPIYEHDYLSKFRGTEMQNESLAALMMYVVVNSGAGSVLVFKKLMNGLAGKKIVAETTTAFTSKETELLNELDQKDFFDLLKLTREKFYRNQVVKFPKKKKFLKGWLARLDKYKFSPVAVKTSSLKKIFMITLIVLLLIFLYRFFR